MEDDSESRLLRELAEIEDFKNKVGELQTDIEELSNKIDKIEILDIQKQLNSLHDSLLETQKRLAEFRINYETTNIKTMLSQHQHIRSQLLLDAANLKPQISASNEPFELVNEFHHKWVKKLEELNIKFLTF